MQSINVCKKLRKKYKSYSAIEKLNILKELNENISLNALAQQYNVDNSTIRNWKRNRSKLEELCQNNPKLQQKRQRKLKYYAVDKALFIWFEEMRLRLMPLNGPLLQAKALELAKEMNISENFAASEGWLSKWKVRYNIRSLTICGEKMSANVEAAEKFKEDLEQNMEKDLTLAQIFNADETGLNYKMLPKKTLAGAKEHQASGFKQSKDRVTIMICSNADGSLKLPLVVIGKSANPRKLKNISKDKLPVYYTSQKSAWMNSDIFEKWFKEEFVPRVTAFLKKKALPLKAVLFLDNAPCHPSAQTLSVNDVKVHYLPPNTTSLIQPMDQGIIENLKRRYRSQLLRCSLYAQKNGTNIITFIKSISLKDVIYWISDAWTDVDPAMITKCWKNMLSSKFFEHENNSDLTPESNDTTNDLLNYMQQLHGYEDITENAIQNWIIKDDNCSTPMPSNNKIIQMAENIDESESEKEEEDVTSQEAILAIDKLISYIEKNPSISMKDIAIIRKWKNIAIQSNIK